MQDQRRRFHAGSARLFLGAAALLLEPGRALAQVVATPHPWQIGMQAAHSPVEQQIHSLNALVTWIIVLITAFVAGLMGWTLYRFNEKRHPTPSRTSHNTVLEVAWTVLPVLILVIIAIPSFQLVYYENRTYSPDMTIKVTGHQWYWSYDYPDQNNLHFDSYMVPDKDEHDPALRRLAVDNPLVVPVGKNIRILTTSGDVIHSFFIPSLGVQRYAIPGQTIETWVRVNDPGTYYGECNQICGENHSQMSIAVHAVPEPEFQAWLAQAKTKFSDAGGSGPARVDLASAEQR